MRILFFFIHQNFPGQFVHLARALARLGHEVRAVTDAASKQPKIVPTRTYRVDGPRQCHPAGAGAVAQRHRLRVARRRGGAGASPRCGDEGFVPDLVIGHPGWGETLFVKDVFPRAKLIVHAEYYHNAEGADADFDPNSPSSTRSGATGCACAMPRRCWRSRARDAAVTSTRWQAGRFPAEIRRKIGIIHEGIDTDAVAPGSRAALKFARDTTMLRAGQEVITFASRNLEPYRGYHIFMRALPEILRARPKACQP